MTLHLHHVEQPDDNQRQIMHDAICCILANNMPSWSDYGEVPPSEIFPTRPRYQHLAEWCERIATAIVDADPRAETITRLRAALVKARKVVVGQRMKTLLSLGFPSKITAAISASADYTRWIVPFDVLLAEIDEALK